MNEDISELFARNLRLVQKEDSAGPMQQQQNTEVHEQPIKYSITQHYHHSGHAVTPTPDVHSGDSEGDTSSIQPLDIIAAEALLRKRGIDPLGLMSSQIELFQRSQPMDRERLVDLWLHSPPEYGGRQVAQDQGHWPVTSLAQEEYMTRLRVERRHFQDSQLWGYSDTSRGQGTRDSRQEGGLWTPDSGIQLHQSSPLAEPYITEGFNQQMGSAPFLGLRTLSDSNLNLGRSPQDADAYVHALDPAYRSPDWKHYLAHQDMECQYGALEQMNELQDDQHEPTLNDEHMNY